MRLAVAALLVTMSVPCAQAQLYLLTGTADEKHPSTFASALFRVGNDGSVRLSSEVVPQETGTEWIGISYEWRKVVLDQPDHTVVVIDFDRAAVVKRCKAPVDPRPINAFPPGTWVAPWVRVYSWLANTPAGPSFQWLDGTSNREVVRGMVLDPSVPCESSIDILPPEAVRDVVSHGDAGPSDWSSRPYIGFGADWEQGDVTVHIGEFIPLGYEVPASFRKSLKYTDVSLVLNDSHAFMICLANRQGHYRYVLFRKSDKTWHAFPVVSEATPYVRSFGRYIAAIEVRKRSAKNPKSLRQDRWRKEPTKMGPGPGGWIWEQDQVLPGVLSLYDLETERVFRIPTTDGDSEVLLVEDRTVYYRVGEQLFSAPILEKGLGPSRLVAKDENIADAHWAFIKR